MENLNLTRVQTNIYDNEKYAVYNVEMKKCITDFQRTVA